MMQRHTTICVVSCIDECVYDTQKGISAQLGESNTLMICERPEGRT